MGRVDLQHEWRLIAANEYLGLDVHLFRSFLDRDHRVFRVECSGATSRPRSARPIRITILSPKRVDPSALEKARRSIVAMLTSASLDGYAVSCEWEESSVDWHELARQAVNDPQCALVLTDAMIEGGLLDPSERIPKELLPLDPYYEYIVEQDEASVRRATATWLNIRALDWARVLLGVDRIDLSKEFLRDLFALLRHKECEGR